MAALYHSVRCAFAWVPVLACSCTGVSVVVPAVERMHDAATSMQHAADASPPDAAEPADAGDASMPVPNAPAADAGPTLDAGSGNSPPAAACRFEAPLQVLPEWRDEPATVVKRIPIEHETRGIGSDGQTGLWLLSGLEGQAELKHVDSEGNQLSVDTLQTLARNLQLGAAAEPLIAGTLDAMSQKLGDLSIDTQQQGVYVARRRGTGFDLLGLFEWRGDGAAPLVMNVLDAGATGVYVGIQLFGPGTLTPPAGALAFTNDDSYRFLIALISNDGSLRFLKPAPGIASQPEVALAADGRLLISGANNVAVWNDAGDMLAQLPVPTGDYKPFLSGDAAGNVYAALSFSMTLSVGAQTFVANGVSDILLLMLDARGELGWSKQLGGTGQEQPLGLRLDARGDLLVTGNFAGATDLGGGPLVSAPGVPFGPFDPVPASSDAFVAKFAPDGTPLGSMRLGGSPNEASKAAFGAGDSDAWLWFSEPDDFSQDVGSAVRVRFDAASAKHEPIAVKEPFTRSSVAASSGVPLAVHADTLLIGPVLELRVRQGAEFVSMGMLERPSDAPQGFGDALAIDAKLAVVGGSTEADWGLAMLPPGAVHVYERTATGFAHAAQLHAADPDPAGFGHAVAVIDETVFVSAFDGSVYVFDKGANGWERSAQLSAAAGQSTVDNFGWSLAAQGSDLIVSHPGYRTSGDLAGAVFVYRAAARGDWQLVQRLEDKNAPPAVNSCREKGCGPPINAWGLGTTLSADDTTLAASSGLASTMVSLYVREQDKLRQVQTLGEEPRLPFYGRWYSSDHTETPLSLRGDFLAVGTPAEESDALPMAGAAYVFQRVDGRWIERGRIQSGVPVAQECVGEAVALYQGGLLVTAPGERVGSLLDLPLEPAVCR